MVADQAVTWVSCNLLHGEWTPPAQCVSCCFNNVALTVAHVHAGSLVSKSVGQVPGRGIVWSKDHVLRNERISPDIPPKVCNQFSPRYCVSEGIFLLVPWPVLGIFNI